ncbi:MAG: hypothetical protein V3U57_06565 [Robiginitomaculum sp.]
MNRIIGNIAISILFGILARISIMLMGSIHFRENVFSKAWKLLQTNGINSTFSNVAWFGYESLSTNVFVPFFENLFLMAIVLICQKIHKSWWLPLLPILFLSYFEHGSGLFGVLGATAFFFFYFVYFYVLQTNMGSHTKAYIFSTFTHCFYNFTGEFLAHVYSISP